METNKKISDRLRFIMQQTDSPKLIEICGMIASLDIKIQEAFLDCIEQKIPLKSILIVLESLIKDSKRK